MPPEIPGLLPIEVIGNECQNAKNVQKTIAERRKDCTEDDISNERGEDTIQRVEPITLERKASSWVVKKIFKPKRIVENGKRFYLCGYTNCTYKRVTRAAVLGHVNTYHLNLGSNNCECGFATSNSDSWQKHKKEGCFTSACTICPYKCSLKSNLKTHMKSHEKGTFECRPCGKLYKHKQGLSRHNHHHHQNRYLNH